MYFKVTPSTDNNFSLKILKLTAAQVVKASLMNKSPFWTTGHTQMTTLEEYTNNSVI